jgi:hypothetical protein
VMLFVTAFGMQWGIGEVINLWPISPDGNYAPEGYKAGFGLMFLLQVLSVLWFITASLIMRKQENRT